MSFAEHGQSSSQTTLHTRGVSIVMLMRVTIEEEQDEQQQDEGQQDKHHVNMITISSPERTPGCAVEEAVLARKPCR
jgi:hypothetical protein